MCNLPQILIHGFLRSFCYKRDRQTLAINNTNIYIYIYIYIQGNYQVVPDYHVSILIWQSNPIRSRHIIKMDERSNLTWFPPSIKLLLNISNFKFLFFSENISLAFSSFLTQVVNIPWLQVTSSVHRCMRRRPNQRISELRDMKENTVVWNIYMRWLPNCARSTCSHR